MTRRSSARDKTLEEEEEEEEVGEEEEASSAPALSCLTDGITVGHIAFRPQTLRIPRILSVSLSRFIICRITAKKNGVACGGEECSTDTKFIT